ncbi:rhamnulose-1-phosphate aldolase [Caldibacillus thermolactis]|jgi:rhamnulose-1-phosphate aldolase|uniref:Rhamnulose-1-phosphate aldolase n=1 Tax=Pallidibacillus thermolactis TaxID=251051 RepID=A0ABT2WLS6_9BACI|nr:rhamnulose-1-phosphate aldolase [Pallidibacillus thermolactis]MCU9595649.1 rhamnulose-1-phosphate aldolase [Pallidibacillus thermolactis]
MTNFIDSPYVKEFSKITFRLYDHGWDERNGGNISYRLTEEEVSQYDDVHDVLRTIPIDFDGKELAGMFFLVTGTGRYFKNIIDFPERDSGLVRITEDGKSINILWGFNDGGKPTSEFPTHLMGHAARLKVDPNQRVIMHCHPTNLIALTFTFPLDEKELTRTLWKMQTESIVVFPDGIGIIPWMVPGNSKIGNVTSEKLKEFSSVIWPHHGIFASGTTIDEAYGLIETIEKAAEIYNIIRSTGGDILQLITDQQLTELAQAFGVTPKEGYLEV